MKKLLNSTVSVILVIALAVCVVSCGAKDTGSDLWKSAVYTSDTELGVGEKTLALEFAMPDKSITFTVKTDKVTVGEALLDAGLIEGEDGPYGLYIKKVNGIIADYDVDQSYWGFYIDGEYAMSGVDSTDITEGAVYKLAYEK